MSISIELDTSSWYTSRDVIRGTAHLETRSSIETTHVKISLYGISRTFLTRIHDIGQKFTDNVEDMSAFLQMHVQLFPPLNERNGTKYTLRPGVHSWPFEFEIPTNTTGVAPHPVPPSLSDLDPDVAYIKYFLEMSYERISSSSSILGTSYKSAKKFLEFLPTDDKEIDLVPTYGAVSSHKAKVVSSAKTVSGLFSRIISSLAHDKAPICTEAGEFVVRAELLLTPGVKFTWMLEAKDTSNEDKLFVTGVKVLLVVNSSIRAKNVEDELSHTILLYEKSQLHVGCGDITSQINAGALIIPETVPPTFRAANINREYLLVFKIKWSHSPGSVLTHKTTLSQKVFIRSGINTLPNYETGDVYRPSRGFPQAKWYYK